MMHSRFAVARQAFVVACASVAIVGVGYVFAAPTAPPPGSTVDLPLTRGANAETKTGPLTIQGLLTASGGLNVSGTTSTGTLSASTICLNGDCKTAWPSGGGGTASASGAEYHPNYNCYAYNSYANLSYYYYGNSNTQWSYFCDNVNYSVTVTSTIPSGKTPGTVLGGTVWCHSGYNYYNGYSPVSSYVNDSYYPYRTAGTVSSIINNNNGTVTINGQCDFHYSGSSYPGIAMRVEGLTFATN